jgi:hypothetical protein
LVWISGAPVKTMAQSWGRTAPTMEYLEEYQAKPEYP